MAQAGIHGLAGLFVKRWTPERRWLLLGIVLGNLAPDLDNVAVAVATLTGGDTEGLHRTFTHSLFTVAAIICVGIRRGVADKTAAMGQFGAGFRHRDHHAYTFGPNHLVQWGSDPLAHALVD